MDLTSLTSLSFEEVDLKKFPAINLARQLDQILGVPPKLKVHEGKDLFSNVRQMNIQMSNIQIIEINKITAYIKNENYPFSNNSIIY